LDTLSTIHPEEVTFTDFVEAGSMLAKELKSKGCCMVIALTHMRTPNDIRYCGFLNVSAKLSKSNHLSSWSSYFHLATLFKRNL